MATSKPAEQAVSPVMGRSVRVKLLLLVAGVALLVGLISAAFQLTMNRQLLREQMVKRGRYIARNLAYNAKYGVLTEDETLLNQLLAGALSAGTEGTSQTADVVGAMIRDAKGTDPRPPRGRGEGPAPDSRDHAHRDRHLHRRRATRSSSSARR